MKKKESQGGFVFSTNPHFKPQQEERQEPAPTKVKQQLQLHRETKGRGGKAVVIVRGYAGNPMTLELLGKKLKTHCGTGGSVKDGEIIIQGDQRQKVADFLIHEGYSVKFVGG